MPRKPRKRTRKKQKGGVNFRNILTEENAHRFDIHNYYMGSDTLNDVYIKIIPMPWMPIDKDTIFNHFNLAWDDISNIIDIRNVGEVERLRIGMDGIHNRLQDIDYPDDVQFPVIEAVFPTNNRMIWNTVISNHTIDGRLHGDWTADGPEVAEFLYLRIPRNTQEVIDTLHGDRSHHLDYLVEVVHGYDTTAHISRIADRHRERMDHEDKPDEPDKYRRANESIIRLQSRARGRNTRKNTRSSRQGIWEPTRNPREQMRRWTDMSRNVMEDDPMRGYEQFRIYDPIRGYQNEEIEPYDKRFLETYDRIKNTR